MTSHRTDLTPQDESPAPSAETALGAGGAPSISADERSVRHGASREPTRAASAYRGLMAGALVLVLLVVFILENLRSVRIEYFGAGFNLPLGVALLIAALAGALLFGLVGGVRILQLRLRATRGR